jgi:hypothetical protein
MTNLKEKIGNFLWNICKFYQTTWFQEIVHLIIISMRTSNCSLRYKNTCILSIVIQSIVQAPKITQPVTGSLLDLQSANSSFHIYLDSRHDPWVIEAHTFGPSSKVNEVHIFGPRRCSAYRFLGKAESLTLKNVSIFMNEHLEREAPCFT